MTDISPRIWSSARRARPQSNRGADEAPGADEVRSVFQQDYDRLLFSTPVRRLADKTQVWPMDENDGVRTRLTHSHEVANLARSIGARAFAAISQQFGSSDVGLTAVVQPILQAAGLGHDLGNPPFGHQGEAAIGTWFRRRETWIFSHQKQGGEPLVEPIPHDYQSEFTEFDGNPQSLRLLSKLQTHIDGIGLDLTAATLAAGLKYPVSFANKGKRSNPTGKKGGYFLSELDVVEWLRSKTGLGEWERHPLTWIMEACDDIAYSVLDIDDVLKKELMSPDDVLAVLRRKCQKSLTVDSLTDKFQAVESREFGPVIQRDIKIQYLRALLIADLISHASSSFQTNSNAIFAHEFEAGLMDDSKLCEQLKIIARENAFNHPDVLRAEAIGAVAIDGLMSAFWEAIAERKKPDDLMSGRTSARAKYIFSQISPNYLLQATTKADGHPIANSMRYKELRLLTDMISGMTDTFALRLWKDISSVPHACST